jgi:hypothetical protein
LEYLCENREVIIGAFRKRVLEEYGQDVVDPIFDWTSLVYFGYKPELAMRGHSKDGHPEECQMDVGIAQLAKPLCIPDRDARQHARFEAHDRNCQIVIFQDQERKLLTECSKVRLIFKICLSTNP